MQLDWPCPSAINKSQSIIHPRAKIRILIATTSVCLVLQIGRVSVTILNMSQKRVRHVPVAPHVIVRITRRTSFATLCRHASGLELAANRENGALFRTQKGSTRTRIACPADNNCGAAEVSCCFNDRGVEMSACIVLSSALLFVLQPPDALELEKRALSGRAVIQRGRVDFDVDRTLRGVATRGSYIVVFDGSKTRTDMVRSMLHNLSDGRSIDSVNTFKFVFTDADELYYFDFAPDELTKLAAYKRDVLTEAGRRSAKGDAVYRIDPRRLGIVPGSVGALHSYSVEDILGRPDRRNASVRMTEEKSASSWRIEYERSDGTAVMLLIDPAKGDSLVEASFKCSTREGELSVERVVNEMTQYGSEQIWFPQTVTFSHSIGDREAEGATYTVRRAEFNIDIDPSTFTLAGMNIPPGTMVEEIPQTDAGIRYWDGTELRTEAELRPRNVLELETTTPKSGVKWGLILAGNVLLLFAFVSFVIWRHSIARRSEIGPQSKP
jgi:hypothetical protein